MASVRRVYLPLSAEQVQALSNERRLAADPLTGFAITDQLRASSPSGGDEEEQEYAALQQAASAAAQNGQRVVAAADIDAHQVESATGQTQPAQVVVREGLDLRRVVSMHVLDPADERDAQSDLGLSWYDVSELGELGDLLDH